MAIRIKRPRIGITLRFFLLFASVGLIPIGFMSFYAFWQINRQVAFDVENNLTNVGLRFRDDVSRTIDEATRIDESIAADPVFTDGRARRADIEREMERIRDEFPQIRGLYLLKGREVLSSSGPRVFVSGDPGILDFSTAAPYVSAPRPFPDNVNPAFLVSVPVKTGPGAMPTVLVAAVDARALMDAARLVRIGETGRAYVLDDSGTIVAGPDAAGLFVPFADEAVTRRIATVGEGIIHYTVHTADGPDLRHIAFVASVPEGERPSPRGLRVLVTYGEDEAYLVADQIGDSIGLALIMILAATSLFSFLLSRTITRPIREISRGTERIRAGDFSRDIDGALPRRDRRACPVVQPHGGGALDLPGIHGELQPGAGAAGAGAQPKARRLREEVPDGGGGVGRRLDDPGRGPLDPVCQRYAGPDAGRAAGQTRPHKPLGIPPARRRGAGARSGKPGDRAGRVRPGAHL